MIPITNTDINTTSHLMEKSALLKIESLTKHFDGVIALSKVDLCISEGEILSLIGPNGSGKTTLFNCVTGFLRPDEGHVIFKEKDITVEQPHRIALYGIGRTFQNVRIFPSLTVFDNVLVSIQQHQEDQLFQRLIRSKKIRDLESLAINRAEEVLDLVRLIDYRDDPAEKLVYGQRKQLEFACALAPNPDLVMLDEPAAGVNTTLVDLMKSNILDLNSKGKTFLIVEHNMGVVMDISKRIVVLDHGVKIAEGSPSAIRDNPEVKEAYFGK